VKGFFAAVFGAFTLLFFYRLLSGSFLRETNGEEDRWLYKVKKRLRKRQVLEEVLRDAL
jgi:hypothetical protein